MIRKVILLIVVFMLITINSIVYYNKTYLKEDRLSSDIQRRVKNNNNMVNNFKILQQKDMNNLRIILYSYTMNKLNLVDCSIYEKTYNERYKFIKGQQPGISTGNMFFSMGKQKNTSFNFIHFGYISDIAPNKYEITYGDKTFIKEYNRNEPFLELYDLRNGGVGIRPIYESKLDQ